MNLRLRYWAGRAASLVVTLMVSSVVIYAALDLVPGGPIAAITGGRPLTPQALAELEARYHLNDPFLVRYGEWLLGVLQGDLGRSAVNQQQVSSIIAERAGNTVGLVAYAALLIIVAGVSAGAVSALYRRISAPINLATTIGLATPSFVAAMVLISFFAVRLGWFPVFGVGSGFADQVRHLTLPAVALAVSGTAYVARVSRAAVGDELRREHVETARSRGFGAWHVVRRHILRNALIPITTVGGLTVAGLIASAAVVETAFNIPGLGSTLINAASASDLPVAQAVALILVAAFVVVNMAVDALALALDPRIGARGRRV